MKDIPISIVLDGYGQWVRERVESGFKPYLMTFMFNPLPGSMQAKKDDMLREITKVYRTMNTKWFHRNPRSTPMRNRPLWIVGPDLPVPKRYKDTYRDLAVNDGLHCHAIVLVPAHRNRMSIPFDDFVDMHQAKWTGEKRNTFRIHCVPVDDNVERVTDYVLKNIKRGNFPLDDILVLPPSDSERPTTTKAERKEAKMLAEQHVREPQPNAHRLSAEAREVIPPHGLK